MARRQCRTCHSFVTITLTNRQTSQYPMDEYVTISSDTWQAVPWIKLFRRLFWQGHTVEYSTIPSNDAYGGVITAFTSRSLLRFFVRECNTISSYDRPAVPKIKLSMANLSSYYHTVEYSTVSSDNI